MEKNQEILRFPLERVDSVRGATVVFPRFLVSDSQVYLEQIAAVLAKHKIPVTCVGSFVRKDVRDLEGVSYVKVVKRPKQKRKLFFASRHFFSLVHAVINSVQAKKSDVIITSSPLQLLFYSFSPKLFSAQKFLVFSEIDLQRLNCGCLKWCGLRKTFAIFFEKILLTLANKVIVPTKVAAKVAKTSLILTEAKVEVYPYSPVFSVNILSTLSEKFAIDSYNDLDSKLEDKQLWNTLESSKDKYRSSLLDLLMINDSSKLIGMIITEKNISDVIPLLRAVSAINKKDFILVLCTTSKNTDYIAPQVLGHGMSDQVYRLELNYNNFSLVAKGCDLLVAGSQPGAHIGAICYGLGVGSSVFAGDTEAHKELLQEEVFLFDSEDVDDLALRLKSAFSNKRIKKSMTKRVHELVEPSLYESVSLF